MTPRMVSVGVLCLLMLAGCRSHPELPYTTWFEEPPRRTALESATAGFDAYLAAALQVQKDDELGVARVSFTPGQRKEAMMNSAAALKRLRTACRGNIEWQFLPTKAFEPSPYRSGWLHLGRVLIWELEDAMQEERIGDIVSLTQDTSRFASDLMSGDALDADLGLTLYDQLRKTLAQRFREYPGGTLNALAESLAENAPDRIGLNAMLDNERENMRAGVQFVQDAYRKRDWKTLEQRFGGGTEPAIKALQDMARKDGDERIRYFEAFAREADSEIVAARDRLAKPLIEWGEWPTPEGSRPWRRFSKQLFHAPRPVLTRYTVTLARHRLLVLECRLRAIVRANRAAPQDLSKFDEAMVKDPITGRPFRYSAAGVEFRLYSPGEDNVDNGGATNEEYRTPDLKLENPT